jgi:hypothetical protein
MHLYRSFLGIGICCAFIQHACAQGYQNIAPAQQLSFLVNCDQYGSGLSACDFDQDGWDDLTFGQWNDSLRFYRNVNGTLQLQPSFVYGAGSTRQVLWADYDNDGDKDLVVTYFNGVCKLYRNDGNFVFTDVSAAAGLITAPSLTYGASFGDYDRDGYLDLYVCNYEALGDETLYQRLNHLYRNNGDGTFTDVTIQAGVGDGIKLSFMGMWMDYDLDGWQDLFVINDRWHSNSMYRNMGNGTFQNVSNITGIMQTGQDPMSISFADFDNDGDMDIFHSNTGQSGKHTRLLENNGDGTFFENSIARGLAVYQWSWGACWTDMNNDSNLDLYVTTAIPSSPSDPNVLLGNTGNGQFVNATALMAGSNNALSFSPVECDIDRDGYADIAVSNRTPYPPYLWKNNGGTNNSITVTLQGTLSNRDAVGSWIRVFFNGQMRLRYTVCGENFIGQSSQHLIIGLGTNTMVDSIQVQYLSGHTDRYYNLPVNTRYTFIEGETYTASIEATGSLVLCAGGSVMLDAGDHAAWTWSTGHTERTLVANSPGSYWATVTSPLGIQTNTDTVIVLFDASAAPLAQVVEPSCYGGSNGSIVLLGGEIDMTGVTWSVPGNGPVLEQVPAGIYTYAYSTLNGCDGSGAVEVGSPSELLLTGTALPASMGNNGEILITVEGGTLPYQVTLNDTPVDMWVQGLMAGTYDLQVTDDQGCVVNIWVVVENTTSVGELLSLGMVLHPNPVDDRFVLTGHGALQEVLLLDLRGAIAARWTAPFTGVFDVAGLAPGTYTLHCTSNSMNPVHHRLIKLP